MARAKSPVKAAKKKAPKKDIAASYNEYKLFGGQQYTGMKIGRSHKWNYEAGVWKETKVTPDLWDIDFAVTKRRAGKAPEGSGVPVGTEYHWYILAHQHVKKLDANSYSTSLSGLKYKLAHRRADKDKWNITEKGQRKRLVKILQELIDDLQKESDPSDIPVPEVKKIISKKEIKPVAKPVKKKAVSKRKLLEPA
jgi:hypothetical protein